MSYTNPTPNIAALRTMLFALPVIVGLGWTVAMYHYPDAVPVDQNGATVDALPLFEAEEMPQDNSSNIAGGAALASGGIILTLAAAMSAGELEALCQTIATQLRNAQTGLPIVNAVPGKASDISVSAQAAQDSDDADAGQIAFRTCSIDITFGLSY